MSSHPDGNPGGSQGSSSTNRPGQPGAQGASRGGVQPDDTPHEDERTDEDERQSAGQRRSSYDPNAAYDRGRSDGGAPFGGYPFTGSQSRRSSGGWRTYLGGDARFLGLPVGLIYALGAALIAIVFVGAVCGAPTKTGSVAGQVKQLNADRSVATLAGAALTLRGGGNTYTTTSTEVDPSAEGEAAYNYRFENVPPGNYALSVTPPAGATLQSEDDLNLKVESGQLFPQSVMLLDQSIQKPRQLAQNELQAGEAGGYVDDRGQRHTYQQGSGFDASDALLMYLLWRNPPGWGYGAPPVIVSSPGSSNYRVANPPSQTRTGQTVTQQRPSTPGQGSTRPSSGSGATGSAPSRTSGSGDGDAVAPSTGASSGSNTGSNTSTQTKPSTSVSAPSQGASRPSSSSSSPSRSSAPSRSSGSSGGGRR
jgi:hypothetical protein